MRARVLRLISKRDNWRCISVKVIARASVLQHSKHKVISIEEHTHDGGRRDAGPGPAGSNTVVALPGDADGLKRYLVNELEGVGPATAEKIVEAFGVEALGQVLSGADCASRLAQEAGVRPNLAEDIARQWKRKIEFYGERELAAMIRLTADIHLTPKRVDAVRAKFGSAVAAMEAFSINPWGAARSAGLSWLAGEQVAEALGREPGSKDRGREALVHALGLAGNDGHTGLPWRELMQETLDLMRTTGRPWPEDAAPLAGCAGQLRKAGRLVVERPDSLAQTEGGLPWDTAERRDALRRQAAEKIHPDDW
ncbi:exodeoxyribonuclease V alpha subunit [Monoraphidium neglectum]|uniref:Exodeoxyribonuclease V alpha subunit n=1 Tax=Monoraphidium neglectum TaxID=145388 RepID=A0A0D2KWQ6_9CHLO|nr:exodeoxyribonuclease V alpha subunit [Monoraphidium neglectum]KIY99673.1 exodeoxyribonuclease V alpha subunit [Monoraphidium neglectum]|eukprot:XP_013898693.1 exodeoxyribonuclease V alpha subunit [Monoraphidium neglectum]